MQISEIYKGRLCTCKLQDTKITISGDIGQARDENGGDGRREFHLLEDSFLFSLLLIALES